MAYANCLEGYLTPECASCPYWADGSDPNRGIGCACNFPIMECKAFAEMWEKENSTSLDPYFDLQSDLPKAIYTVTKNGEVIVMEANTFTQYTKGYYRTSDINATDHTNIRRVKYVKLPVYIDGTVYTTTDKLFMHLLNTGRYSLCCR